MMKLWIVLLLVSFPIAFQKVICDETGKYSCPDDWECCKSPRGGYGCCHQPKACASDGRCYLFNPLTLEKEITDPVPARKVPDLAILLKSFLKSIGFFEYIPETCKCVKNFKPLIPDVIEIIKKIKKIETAEELIPILIEAYTKLAPQIQRIIAKCHDVPFELKALIKEIVAKVSQPDFASKIVVNVQKNYTAIMVSANKGIKMIKDKDLANAGAAFAEVFKYIFKGI